MKDEVLHQLALETLKAKVNLADSDEDTIMQNYYQIYANLKRSKKEHREMRHSTLTDN